MSYEPAVYAGQPPAAERYDRVEANGVKIYLPQKAVTAPDGVKISLGGIGAWRRLKIQGLLH